MDTYNQSIHKTSIEGKYNFAIHAVIWLAYILLLTVVFSNFIDLNLAIKRSFFTASLEAVIFYLNVFVLVPKLYENQKIILYIIATLGVVALIVWLNNSIMSTEIFTPKFHEEFRNKIGRNFFNQFNRNKNISFNPGAGFMFIIRSLSGLLFAFLASWLYINKRKSDERKRWEVVKKGERLESEMKFLKSQINPHFLFNMLNNIYTLSRTGSSKAPEMIMRLSKMLRYNLYECNANKVTLGQEINYIENFIAFQQLKTKTTQNIITNFKQADHSIKVSPLLFISFIENSFKHSYIEDISTGWVSIRLETTSSKIKFTISNSIPQEEIQKDDVGGIGLENVKRRLELEYPDKHNLNIKKDVTVFLVLLELHL